jgi:hypothetical protein
MSHIDWFRLFFQERTRGTAKEICDYLVANNIKFNCSPNRRITSVSSHLNKECQRSGGFIGRELNTNGVYIYFSKE